MSGGTSAWTLSLGPDIKITNSEGVTTDLGDLVTADAVGQNNGISGLDASGRVTAPVAGDVSEANITLQGVTTSLTQVLIALKSTAGTPGANGTNGVNGQGFTLRGVYAAQTAYAVDDVVTYQGAAYAALVAFTSGATFDSTKWQVLSAQGAAGTNGINGLGFNLRGVWAANTAYAVDDVVSYLGSSYAALSAFISTSTFVASNWEVMASAGAAGGTGASGTNFLTSTTVPTASLGNNGDSCLVLSTGEVYQKTSGAWVDTGTTLRGLPGINGVSFNVRGPWTANTAYALNDVVTYLGSGYSAIAAFTSGSTFDITKWNLLVSVGANGTNGTNGINGTNGANGTSLNLRGAWTANTAYVVNDIVTYQGSCYGAPTAFTSSTSFNSANWILLASAGVPGLGFNVRGAWAANTVYATNDVVSYQGSSYSAITGFTSAATFNAANWNLLAASGQAGTAGGDLTATSLTITAAGGKINLDSNKTMWVQESNGKVIIGTGTTNLFSIDSSGNVIAAGTITTASTP